MSPGEEKDHIITPIDRPFISITMANRSRSRGKAGPTENENARMYATERIIQQMPDFAFSDADASALLVQLRSFTDESYSLPISVRHPMCRRCVWPA
jgi:hypothetical protein